MIQACMCTYIVAIHAFGSKENNLKFTQLLKSCHDTDVIQY